MSVAPQNAFEYITAISVPMTIYAIRYALVLSRRFLVLETLFKARVDAIAKIEAAQETTRIQLALHEQDLKQMKTDLGSISAKLESLPRIATMLENWGPLLASFVPRNELDQRFKSVEAWLTELKHTGN
jgi:hypothetical protein